MLNRGSFNPVAGGEAGARLIGAVADGRGEASPWRRLELGLLAGGVAAKFGGKAAGWPPG